MRVLQTKSFTFFSKNLTLMETASYRRVKCVVFPRKLWVFIIEHLTVEKRQRLRTTVIFIKRQTSRAIDIDI